jgi:oxygen-dependent protoporphyrinogen oxidase
MLSQMKARAAQQKAGTLPPPLPLFMTLRGGLAELVNTLVGTLDGELITGVGVTGIESPGKGQGGLQLHLSNGETRFADAVVLATPAPATADLLEPFVPDAAQMLRRIRYLSTATVSMAFNRNEVSHPLDGFGFVVPKSEPCKLMACTWVSSKFDHRAPEDQVLLRIFVGGYKNQALVDLPDEELISLVRAELRAIMGITAEPTRKEIYRWPHGNAQYDVGHLDRIAQIEAQTSKVLPDLYLTGSSFRGVGLPDCIHQAEQTVGQVIGRLKETSLT